MNLQDVREEYKKASLDEKKVHSLPIMQFREWLQVAIDSKVPHYNAMTLATVNNHGQPRARMVLVKEVLDNGLVFYTNYASAKGEELAHNNKASLLFFWEPLERQVRLEGTIEKVSEEMSEAYFKSRPLDSQIGAVVSNQSQTIGSRSELDRQAQLLKQQYEKTMIMPRPAHWGGYILKPNYFEFWQGRPSRLHDRIAYQLIKGSWHITRLAP
jgi:pyridoxamine 5'-phosphate oxidase